MGQLFTRPSGGEFSVREAAAVAATYVAQSPASVYTVTIGTDSQNFDKTKMVEVIAVHRVGNGGIFFYRTQRSLELASEFFDEFHESLSLLGHDLDHLSIKCQIHCDVGHNGNTKAMIQEIVGWVRSLGYECAIKPDSYAASGIANKYSK